MEGQQRERWKRLCELIADEQDPQRFSELVAQLREELNTKFDRRTERPKDTAAD